MYNLDEEKLALKALETDLYDKVITTSSEDAIVDHLNL